jgi:hypothetical protein
VYHSRYVPLQLASMVEKIECCEMSHAQLERHSNQMRQQLESQQAKHDQQNTELRTVLQDSQAGLKHLVRDKVCARRVSVLAVRLEHVLVLWPHASQMPGERHQCVTSSMMSICGKLSSA